GRGMGEIRRRSPGVPAELREALEEAEAADRKPRERAPLAAAVDDADVAATRRDGGTRRNGEARRDGSTRSERAGPTGPDGDGDGDGADRPASPATARTVRPAAGADRTDGDILAPEVADALDEVVAAASPATTDGADPAPPSAPEAAP